MSELLLLDRAGRRRSPATMPAPEPSCGARPSQRASGDASLHISSGTLTLWKWPTNGITSVYVQGIDNAEIINAVHARRAPTIPVSTTPWL